MMYSHFVQIILSNKYEDRSKDCKKKGALYRPRWLAREEILRFKMVKKDQNTFRNCKLWRKSIKHI